MDYISESVPDCTAGKMVYYNAFLLYMHVGFYNGWRRFPYSTIQKLLAPSPELLSICTLTSVREHAQEQSCA